MKKMILTVLCISRQKVMLTEVLKIRKFLSRQMFLEQQLCLIVQKKHGAPDGSFKTGKKFLHVSTDEVYGSLPDDGKSYFYETTPYQPHSPYSASKASSDMLVKAYIDTYHFPANVTNTSNNYGTISVPGEVDSINY